MTKNINTRWPPLGWRARDAEGFYWTSASDYRFFYMSTNAGNIPSDYASADDYFSVRCIMDASFTPTCSGEPFDLVTQQCVGGRIL